jgi:hypothetical protein
MDMRQIQLRLVYWNFSLLDTVSYTCGHRRICCMPSLVYCLPSTVSGIHFHISRNIGFVRATSPVPESRWNAFGNGVRCDETIGQPLRECCQVNCSGFRNDGNTLRSSVLKVFEEKAGEYGMWKVCIIVAGVFAAMPSATALAQDQSYQVDGVAAIAAGSINPPDPVAGCNQAKQDAQNKATKAGYNGRVVWSHLSNDSDCKLSTPGARGVGYFYIFTATGTFYRSS